MRTPKFWQTKNLTAYMFYPLGLAYGFATALRLKLCPSKKVNCPVICVGNLTAGGTGKTPVCLSLAKILQNSGKNPSFISRGYGGILKSTMVNPQIHHAHEVGDEPLLLARVAPTIIDSDRYNAASIAKINGADVIIMDDGFQNPSLHRDLSFIVVDGSIGFGNGFCIPAGPLREPVKKGLKRADALIIIGENKQKIGSDLPTFQGHIVSVKSEAKRREIVAFAGIGRPEKFYDSLKRVGFNLIRTFNFPDHHQYKDKELLDIVRAAEGLEIFTTSKDFVKIPKHLQSNFRVLEIEIKWNDEDKLKEFILSKIH